MFRVGDLVRSVPRHADHPNELGVVRMAGDGVVNVRFIHGGSWGFYPYNLTLVDPDTLTDEECVKLMKWKLTHA